MKITLILSVLLSFSGVKIVKSQITAGEIPINTIVSNPNVNLSVNAAGQLSSGSIDVDCDSIVDLSIELYKGYTVIDDANSVKLKVANSLFEICDSTALGGFGVNYYNYGDSLKCSDSVQWSNDSIYYMGSYGCMDCTGPFTINNLYIAFRKNDGVGIPQMGWFKVSFNLNDLGNGSNFITLSITEVLSLCNTNNVPKIELNSVLLSPNPTSNGIIRLNYNGDIHKLELIDITGQLLATYNNKRTEIHLPEKGLYFLKVWINKENYLLEKVISN